MGRGAGAAAGSQRLTGPTPKSSRRHGSAPGFNKASVVDYTEGILKWWRINGGSFKAWALAARVVFAISPNSAACERV